MKTVVLVAVDSMLMLLLYYVAVVYYWTCRRGDDDGYVTYGYSRLAWSSLSSSVALYRSSTRPSRKRSSMVPVRLAIFGVVTRYYYRCYFIITIYIRIFIFMFKFHQHLDILCYRVYK